MKKKYYAMIDLKFEAGYVLRLKQMLKRAKLYTFEMASNNKVRCHIIDDCWDFYFINLPAKSYKLNDNDGDRLTTNSLTPAADYISIPMDEKTALKIEKNIEDSKLYIIFGSFRNVGKSEYIG